MVRAKLKHKRLYDGQIFEHNDHTFRFKCEYDQHMREPWKEHDGHGVISDWTSRGKAPGERVLAQDRHSYRYYDIQTTIKQATKDGWGCDTAKLESRLGRKPTKREVIAETVEQDFERMKGWCDDKWHWCGVIVTMLDDDENDTDFRESLWGIDGDDQDEYLAEEAYNLAEECIEQWQRHGATVNE